VKKKLRKKQDVHTAVISGKIKGKGKIKRRGIRIRVEERSTESSYDRKE